MTAMSTLPRPAASAAVVTEFFDRYRAHDVGHDRPVRHQR